MYLFTCYNNRNFLKIYNDSPDKFTQTLFYLLKSKARVDFQHTFSHNTNTTVAYVAEMHKLTFETSVLTIFDQSRLNQLPPIENAKKYFRNNTQNFEKFEMYFYQTVL